MKPPQSSLEDLVAPCGMYCALCSGYLALQNDVKNKGIRMPYCQGCRSRNKKCAFLKKRCSLLLNRTVAFCYECNDFPCEPLKHLDTRYRMLFKTSFIENLQCIEKKGIRQFLDEQEKKWRCPTCGGLLCCHNGLCFHCDIVELKQKKNRYRWGDE
jgi:hypothetical protein